MPLREAREVVVMMRAAAAMAAVLTLALTAPMTSANAAERAHLRIISTNDIHAYLRPLYHRYLDQPRPWGRQSAEGDYPDKAALEGKVGGMAQVATVIAGLRDEARGGTLIVDSGDTWHGSGLSAFDRGEAMVDTMNAIGYDAMVPGNWEFVYSREHFLNLVARARFPVLAYNLTDKDWGDPVLDTHIIKRVGGVSVAVVGMTYPWTALTTAINGAAKWWNFGIKEREAEELIARIKRESSPDVIVFISHAGFGMDQLFAQRVDGIDVIISGHTHNPVYDPVVWNDTIIYEGGALGKYVSSLDLVIDNKKIARYRYQLIKVNHYPPDARVASIIDNAYQKHDAELSRVIGNATGMFYRRDYWQSTLGNLLTDSLRQMQDTDISFFPAWRYGATLMPGEITVEDVYNIIPTGGRIITYALTGAAVKMLLENIIDGVVNEDPYSRVGGDMIRFSGLRLVFDLSRARGERIISLTAAGKPLVAEQIYTVAAVNTRFQDNPLFGATDVVDTGKIFATELIEYIRTNSPLQAALDDRIRPRRDTGL